MNNIIQIIILNHYKVQNQIKQQLYYYFIQKMNKINIIIVKNFNMFHFYNVQ